MVSGLYDLPGLSATAMAAACANRLELPMTKVSKVYFGFSRASTSRRGRYGSAASTPFGSGPARRVAESRPRPTGSPRPFVLAPSVSASGVAMAVQARVDSGSGGALS